MLFSFMRLLFTNSHTNNNLNSKTFLIYNNIQWETFEGEKFHKFQGFLHEVWGVMSFDGMSEQSLKVC